MPSLRASAVSVCLCALAAAAVLTGCASRFAAQAPRGIRLAGDWKLDPARSDDLGRALTQLRAQQRERDRRARARMGEVTGSRAGPEAGGRPEGRERGASESAPGQNPEEMGIGPLPRLSAADELMSSVPQGEYLRITDSPGAFTVTSGASADQYTPGLESEISAQQGDARQISGWKGAEYVIDTRPQWGGEIIQSYGLTKDGKLRMTVRLTGGTADFTFTRLYDRTTHVAPLAPPTND